MNHFRYLCALEQEDHYHGEEHYLMAGDYLTIRFTGTHTEAAPYYMKLLDHMAETDTGAAVILWRSR